MDTTHQSRAAAGTLLALLLAAAAPASAQQVGTYNGETSQGRRFQITIGFDSESGNYLFLGSDIEWTGLCAKSGNAYGPSGVGIGTWIPFTGNKFKTTFAFQNFYEKLNVKFHAGGTASGTVTLAAPAYTNPPEEQKTESCPSGTLDFTAELAPPAAEASRLAPGTVVIRNK